MKALIQEWGLIMAKAHNKISKRHSVDMDGFITHYEAWGQPKRGSK